MTIHSPFSRRQMLQNSACGFGSLALAGMLGRHASAAPTLDATLAHHAPRAKRVIFLFMQGGVSHVDSFDHKPLLDQRDGERMDFRDARMVANSGMNKASSQRVMKPLWSFKQRGECGRWTSDLFPEMGKHVDDMCFIHSMHTEGVAHGPATLFLHCGAINAVRPSMGSWVSYGLGSGNRNLPDFVTISPSSGNGGARNYGNAFLPSRHQGTAIGRAGASAAEATIRNLTTKNRDAAAQAEQFELMRAIQQEQISPGDDALQALTSSYELAWRMQNHAPEVLNLSGETADTQALYGIGEKDTDNFGRQCLMARRLAESGVRYIQVTYGDNSANPAWDQHSNLPKHGEHAKRVDKPIAGLLTDLKQRGLLEDTIVWWGGEFGRTPYAEKNGTGRDHNPNGFTVWLAGGGFKPAHAHGATDEYGHHAIQDKVHMHDLHATILHQMGLDHEQLTYRYAGRDFRLTDVFGHVVHDILV